MITAGGKGCPVPPEAAFAKQAGKVSMPRLLLPPPDQRNPNLWGRGRAPSMRWGQV